MFGTGGCEQVKSFIFLVQTRGKREHRMKGCVADCQTVGEACMCVDGCQVIFTVT